MIGNTGAPPAGNGTGLLVGAVRRVHSDAFGVEAVHDISLMGRPPMSAIGLRDLTALATCDQWEGLDLWHRRGSSAGTEEKHD